MNPWRLLATSLVAISICSAAPACAGEIKAFIGLKSGQEILDDLEYVVGKLAGEKKIYRGKVLPNVEVFLEGVDPRRPVRFDTILDESGVRRLSMAVPIANEKTFIRQNLNPIGIKTRRRTTTFYQLSDVYEGFLKLSKERGITYGIFGDIDHQQDTDITAADVIAANQRLFFDDFDAAILIDEQSGPIEGRDKITAAIRDDGMKDVVKRPDESDAAFARRKHMTKAQYDRLEVILVGAKRAGAGYSTLAKKGMGWSKFVAEGVPGSELATAIDLVGSEPSKFANVPTVDDPVMTARVALPIYDLRRERFLSLLDVSRPVTLENVDDGDETAAVKEARKTLINLVYDQLVTGAGQTFLSGFYEARAESKGHSIAGGVTTIDGLKINAIIDAIPAALEDSSVERDVDKVGEIVIHKVSVPNLSAPLKDHLGGVTDVYIGVADDAMYLAGGPAGLDLLKKSIDGITPETTDTAIEARFHAAPVAALLDEIFTKRDFSLIEFLQDRRSNRIEERERDPDEVRRMTVADPKKWRTAALETLVANATAGESGDIVELKVEKEDGILVGTSSLGQAILTAAGELIAQFAEENL